MAMTAMIERENWTSYVRRITQGAPRKEIALAAGIHESGLHRWLNSRGRPSAEKVVLFARGLGQRPLDALIAAGYLEPAEAEAVVEVHQDPKELSDDALLAEVGRRLAERPPLPEVDNITRLLAPPDDGVEGIENDR
jgi:transcriptional regulator with XRE-family HTH domain